MDNTIIKNIKSFFLNSYLNTLPFIDPQIVKELQIIDNKFTPKIIKLLNLYFYLYNLNLSHLSFKNKDQSKLFNDFLLFLTSNLTNTNSNYVLKTKQAYQNNLIGMIDKLNESRIIKIKLNRLDSFDHEYDFSNVLDKIKIVDGIKIKKSRDVFCFIAIKYANKFSIEETLYIYDQISIFKSHSKYNRSTASIFSLYLDFIAENNTKLENSNDNLLGEFAFVYFKGLEERKVNIEKYKPFWNGFILFIKDTFKLEINDKFLKIKTTRGLGNQTNIKFVNKKNIKDKLLTDVPLEICDDKAMFILKEKSLQDIKIISNWADYVINDYLDQQDIGTYPFDEFFLEDPETLKTKYKMWRENGIKSWINNNLNTKAIFNKEHLIAAFSILVIEHPVITDGFLKDIEKKSVVKTDQGTFLIGRKHRKGKNYSEQKVLLNERSLKVVNILLDNNKKMGKLVNSDSLTLHTTPLSIFKIVPYQKFKRTKDFYQNIFSFIKNNYSFEDQEIETFINKITLTKIRATCGINEFFKYESTKKMAEILGHERYNSSLLTHYLPEPIIHFYQSRWIRIFQKGIIYEAMKDSDNLLEAIGFENMDMMDEFLKNHTIKNMPTQKNERDNKIVDKIPDFDEAYVSICEENLTALLSIKKAVEETPDKNKIHEKALFWKNFTDRLVNEIENNNSYYSFIKILSTAKDKSLNNLDSYKKVIYA
jgi:hypothetical protein